jgi:hypothetical protein
MPNAPPASCPVPVAGRPCNGRGGVVRYCDGPPVWRRPDGVWFCGEHCCGHVHLGGAAGDLGWWRVVCDDGEAAFWLHDDCSVGVFAYVFPLDGGRWSCAGVAWENDYGPVSLSAVLAPAVRWAYRN